MKFRGNGMYRAKLRSCVRKAVLANKFFKITKRTTTSLLDVEMSKLASWENFDINAVARLSQRKPLQTF